MAQKPIKKKRRQLPQPVQPPVISQEQRDSSDAAFYVIRLDMEQAFPSRVMAFALRHEFMFRSSSTFNSVREFLPGMDYNAYRISIIARQATRNIDDVQHYESEFNRYIDQALDGIGEIYENFFSLRPEEAEKRKEIIDKISVQGARPVAIYTIAPHTKRILRFYAMADDALAMAHYRWLNGDFDGDQLSTVSKSINRLFIVLAQRLTLVAMQCFTRLKKLAKERRELRELQELQELEDVAEEATRHPRALLHDLVDEVDTTPVLDEDEHDEDEHGDDDDDRAISTVEAPSPRQKSGTLAAE